LVGFFLGTVVIQCCIEELDNLGCHGAINDVTVIGGVADVQKWHYMKLDSIAGCLNNAYSDND
jgi:hypothetical protein